MKCSHCKSKLEKDFEFCPHCGEKIEQEQIKKPETNQAVVSEKENVSENKIDLSKESSDDSTVPSEEAVLEKKDDTLNQEDTSSEKDEAISESSSAQDFEKFKRKSLKMRKRSLVYLFCTSLIFLYFTFSSVVVINNIKELDSKVTDFQSFVYNSIANDSLIEIDGVSDGVVTFDKHRQSIVNDNYHVEFYVSTHGDLKFNNTSIGELSRSDYQKFGHQIMEDLWTSHVTSESFEKLNDVTIDLYIDGIQYGTLER